MRNNTRGRFALILLSILLAGVVGCPPGHPLAPVTDDVPMQTVVSRVNRNARGMNFLLRAGGVSASGQIVREDGKKESFDAPGTLFFRRPRNLLMELQHTLGAGKIEIGSNETEFWYWERLDHARYFTANHTSMAKPWETDVPLRPDQFLDMLGLQELPLQSAAGKGPIFKVDAEYYHLDFFDKDDLGRAYRAKTVAVSRRPPFLVSGITYYNSDSRPWMKADLLEYRPIEGTLVLAPRRIEVRSLENPSRLTLEFGNMRPWDKPQVEQQRIAKSPLQRGEDVGQIIRMDRVPTTHTAHMPPFPTSAVER